MSRENLVLTEAGMRRAIHDMNHADRMFKTFNQYKDREGWYKEQMVAQYWKGRLTELKISYNKLKETRETLLKNLKSNR